ncbi:MAG: hypothetical protein WB992_21295 [Bryobacteraceae bacterium]
MRVKSVLEGSPASDAGIGKEDLLVVAHSPGRTREKQTLMSVEGSDYRTLVELRVTSNDGLRRLVTLRFKSTTELLRLFNQADRSPTHLSDTQALLLFMQNKF